MLQSAKQQWDKTVSFYNQNEVFNAVLNKKGVFTIKFRLENAQYFTFRSTEFSDMYLSPDDSLYVTVDTEKFDETIVYQGKGAVANDFLAKMILRKEQIEARLSKFNEQFLIPKSFFKALNESRNNLISILQNQLAEDTTLSEEFINIEKQKIYCFICIGI